MTRVSNTDGVEGDEEQTTIGDFGCSRRLVTDGGDLADRYADYDYDAAPAPGPSPEDEDEDDEEPAVTGTPDEWRENIPKSMKDIDRWLMWSAEPGAPRRPHWKGDFSVSYNDSDDWHTFEEAVEGASEQDSWGIGMVTGDDVAVIDFDGVKDEDGSPVDWMPGLNRLRRAYEGEGDAPYVEWSPSVSGMHIPVAELDKPDWWHDISVDGREHQGIDLLQGQFVTVTGQCERGFDGDVHEDSASARHLLDEGRENIADLNGRGDIDVSGGDGGWSPDDEWLTPEDISDALSHIEPDIGYAGWRNIGFALSDYYADSDMSDEEAVEEALEVFRSWSKQGKKWDIQAEAQSQKIIEDARERADDGASLGTVIYLAQEGGWEMPDPPQKPANTNEEDWTAVEETRRDIDYRAGVNELVKARPDVVDWEYEYSAVEDEPPELVGLKVAEPIDKLDSVYCTLPLDMAEREHNMAANDTIGAKMTDRVEKRVMNAEPLHKLSHRLNALYDDCLNAEARSVAVQRIMQAVEMITIGGADDKTLHCYDPDTGKFEDDGRETVRAVVEAICPARASDHEKREIVSKIADRTREHEVVAFEPRGRFAGEHDDYRVVGNGILKLPTLQPDGSVCEVELLDHSPELRARKGIPTDYNPDADTTEIAEWLSDITAREEDRMAIEEVVGNVLLPDYRHPLITMLHGEGRNSKGTLIDAIVELVGGVHSDAVAGNRLGDLADNDFRTGMLKQALVNVNGDIEARKIQHGSKLKELTGGEAQEGESKFEDSITFRNTAKLIFAGNNPPLPPETTTAWQERWLPIHLPYEYLSDADPSDPMQKEADNNIKRKVTRESNLEALLLLAVEGLARLEDDGDVSLPESPEERLETYKGDADPISRVETELLEAASEPQSRADKYLPKEPIYGAYKGLARDGGVQPIGEDQFFKILKQRMESLPYNKGRPRAPDGDDTDSDRINVLKGIRFTGEAEQYLSEHWLSHPWIQIGNALPAATESEDIVISALTGVPASLISTNKRVDTRATLTKWDVKSDMTMHAFGTACEGGEQTPVIAFDEPRGDELADELPAKVEINAAALGVYEGKLQLQIDERTSIHVLESTHDDQTDVDDSDVVNDATDNIHDRVESDMQELDEAIIDASDGEKSIAAIAGEVSAAVETNDLDVITGRIEKLKTRGDIIVDATDPTDGDSTDTNDLPTYPFDSFDTPEDGYDGSYTIDESEQDVDKDTRRKIIMERVRGLTPSTRDGNGSSVRKIVNGSVDPNKVSAATLVADIEVLVEQGLLSETPDRKIRLSPKIENPYRGDFPPEAGDA